ncbi:hypothetical protein CAEBREN_22126 [Caenorhabditis brenneri]|uniref:KANL2-like probable zinc-finger domain-containing protein n=1 Tax=Caenorhabditis brenneri TaxID=135651 RepID=G0MCK5_CAEBE|nr:hypothetical protein CAEBREN_22126 [Caenorhabditis brenneri]
MKQTSRPPAQYVVAPGTQFKLIANEYDKNKYAQCGYASHRTLIRCKQIRSKEDLAKNGGRCEEHNDFSKLLEQNHKKEIQRCHAENDTNMQRNRYDPWIASNEFITDEDDFLQPMRDAPLGVPESSNDNFLDNHPLRYAEHFTEKDVLRIKMDLVQKDIEDLMEFKRLLTAEAQKEHEQLGDDKEEDRPTGMVQGRLFKASEKYSRKDYLTLTTVDPVYKPCCVGPNMEDPMVIAHIMHSILDKIENVEPVSVESQCTRPALHLSNFCINHIRMDRRQKLFDLCKACGTTAIGGQEPKCSQHLKQQATAETNNCTCIKCVAPPPVPMDSPKEERPMKPESDDEETLGNLSKFESMASPMSQFPSPYNTSPLAQPRRRYQGPPAQVLRPPNMGPPPGSVPYHPNKRPAPMTSLTSAQLHEQQRLKMEEEEAKSQTCSRVRPLDASQYGNGKKKLQNQQRQQSHRLSTPTGSSPYHLQPPQAKKPGITPSPTGSPAGKTFQGWRNQGMSSSQRLPPQGFASHTRYPMQSNRPNPPPPKQIPLERVQEHREPSDHQEDREMVPPRYHQGAPPEPQRRGVPYYRAAYRRADLPSMQQPNRHPSPLTPSTSTSSSQLLAPPQSPQGSPFRPQSRLPMAPHRAIAAGINPADVGTMPQRPPAYRIPQPPAPRHYSPQNQMTGPSAYPPQQFHSPLANPRSPMPSNFRPPQFGPVRMIGTPRPSQSGVHSITKSYVYQGGAPSSLSSGTSASSGTPGASGLAGTGPSGQSGSQNPQPPLSPEVDPVGGIDSGTESHGFDDIDTSGGVPQSSVAAIDSPGAPGTPPPAPLAPTRQRSVEEATSMAGINAIKSLESARHDVRFTNIPVKTYLALSNQQDLGQKTQEEIEKMAAEAEGLEKRKSFAGSGGSSSGGSSSSAAPRTPIHHQPPPPPIPKRWQPMPRGFSPKDSSVPDAVQEVVATPSTGRKRKADTSTGEPEKKKRDVDAQKDKTPKTPGKRAEPTVSTGRTPRAAAVAANHAIVHHQHHKQSVPTTSTPSSSNSAGESSQENPLDLLAELSAAAEIEEEKAAAAKTPNRKTPKRSTPPPAKTPTVTRSGRRSSRGNSLEKEL